ncbi:bolA-like protein 2-like [Planoprotostelium fungivorum]|uniref:BolA-like protein 2-like n=1 Tax=Planoprotostelium fungivorum TaxID=1890364 RepID=A0A2P6NZR6_9EUKA|nr:bolA-like protein 2-like [Planoprotostelium fungivorum]
MPISVEQLESIIKERVPAETVIAEDESSGCGAKFSVIVVSSHFVGKPLLDRHRLVNDSLKEELKSIHALTLKTWTPEQYEKKKNETQ